MGTGTYKVEELAIEEGEIITNGTFDSDVSGWTVVRCALTWQTGGFCRATQNDGAPNNMAIMQSSLTANKRVSIKFRAKSPDTTSKPYIVASHYNGVNLKLQPSLSVDWQNYHFEGAPNTTSFILYLTGTVPDGTVVDIDDISVTEIQPLPNFDTGTKYIQNTSAGTIALPSKSAYGEWEFDMYKGGDANNNLVQFISSANSAPPANNGYIFFFNVDESVRLMKTTGSYSNLFYTAASYISNNTWYRIKVARLKSEGVFKDIPTLQESDFVNTVEPNSYTTFTSHGRYGFSAISNGSATHVAGTADEISIVNTKKYLVEFDAKLNSGTTPTIRMSTALGSTVQSNFATVVNGRNSHILTATGTTTGVLQFWNVSTATDFTISGFTIRRIYDVGTFAVFIKGGSFGGIYTLVDTTGGSGSNPVTDNTYKTSNFFVGDLDSGDKITNIKIKNEVKQ